MDQQKKCLSGMVNGLPVAIPVNPAPGVILHTLPASSSSGLAFLDQIEIFATNNDDTLPARVDLAFVAANGATLLALQTFTIPPLTRQRLLAETPFGGPQSGLGGATIRLQLRANVALSANATAWGWVFTSRG